MDALVSEETWWLLLAARHGHRPGESLPSNGHSSSSRRSISRQRCRVPPGSRGENTQAPLFVVPFRQFLGVRANPLGSWELQQQPPFSAAATRVDSSQAAAAVQFDTSCTVSGHKITFELISSLMNWPSNSPFTTGFRPGRTAGPRGRASRALSPLSLTWPRAVLERFTHPHPRHNLSLFPVKGCVKSFAPTTALCVAFLGSVVASPGEGPVATCLHG